MIRPALFLVFLPIALGAQADDTQGSEVSYDTLEATRVNVNRDWRDARMAPAGTTRIALGAAKEGTVLRLGAMARAGTSAKLALHVGETVVKELTVRDNGRWYDYSWPVATERTDEAACVLTIESDNPFWLGPCELSAPQVGRPNVLIYLVDTLRADHTSLHGYERRTTPQLDTFAKDAVAFTRGTPQSSWTRPSVASLLTGTYPRTHGARDKCDVMRDGLPSLAKALHGNGYETHAFMSNDNCLPEWGIGGDFFNYAFVHPSQHDRGMVDAAVAMLDAVTTRPWFFYVHVMGPHNPYDPETNEDYVRFQPEDDTRDREAVHTLLRSHGGTGLLRTARLLLGVKPPEQPEDTLPPLSDVMTEDRLKQLIIDLYDGDIRCSDRQFGRMLSALKKRGLYDNTLILFLSDHGEEFWEHGNYYHGKTLFEEQLRVPFVVKLPDNAFAGERREEVINLVDVAPTFLDVLGLPAQPRFQGTSFADYLRGGAYDGRFAYASLFSVRYNYNLRTAKTKDSKYLHNLARNRETWFDLAEHPDENTRSRAPGPDGIALQRFAKEIGTLGQSGLHLLITGDLDERPAIRATVSAAGLRNPRLDFPEPLTTLEADEDRVVFTARMRKLPDIDNYMQDTQALFHADIDASGAVAIDLAIDGKPFPDAVSFVGADRTSRALDGTPIPVEALTAPADPIDLAGLPDRTAAYVWFVPPAETITEAEMDPETRENLRALGYLE